MQSKSILEEQLSMYELANNELLSLQKIYSLITEDRSLEDEMLEIASIDANKLLLMTQKMYIACKFSHELDPLNCFMHIHAGSGGTESQDWVRILLGMYTKFCNQKGYTYEIVDILKDESALIKHVTINISGADGTFPYGWFKHEHGIHRFVRISPFDKNARRHTSFVAVSITPEFNDTIDIEINPADLVIKECKASGAGGQHVNKTNSAIQIKHVPTGIVVESQQDRSQHRNRAIAMKLLKSKLYMYEQEKMQKKHQENTLAQDEMSWGNQIRSYVLHPYKLVKDMRSKHEEYNVDAVLDGDIERLILSNINM